MEWSRYLNKEVPPAKELISELNYSLRSSTLVNGETVVFRFLEKGDEPAIRNFFDALPDEEVDMLRDDVRNPLTISRWFRHLDDGNVLALLALEESGARITGVSTIHFMEGVHRHIADVRVVVSKSHRKLGLGSALIKELIRLGNQIGLFYLRAEILAESKLALKAFRQLGFETACTLDSYFLSRQGTVRDVVHMYKRLRASVEEDFFYVF